jgi:hypothetical protein
LTLDRDDSLDFHSLVNRFLNEMEFEIKISKQKGQKEVSSSGRIFVMHSSLQLCCLVMHDKNQFCTPNNELEKTLNPGLKVYLATALVNMHVGVCFKYEYCEKVQ